MKISKTEQTDFPRQKETGRILVNLSGILGALVIAFGGLFLVWLKLNREQVQLLAGSGLIELPQAGTLEAAKAADISPGRLLTEEELAQIKDILEEPGQANPHEPLSGQLSMAQAIEIGRAWLEDFFLPHLGKGDILLQEYKISCYLWAPETANPENCPRLSSWTVSLAGSDVEAVLILNAVSGQILDASVSCCSPVEYQERETLTTLLADFAFSFGLDGEYTLVYSGETESGAVKLPWYQSLGAGDTFAAIQASSIVATAADADTGVSVYLEQFNIHLYLSSGPEMQ